MKSQATTADTQKQNNILGRKHTYPHTYEHSPIIISYIWSERHTDRLRLEDDDGDDGVYVCGCMYRADELEFKIDLPAD